MFRQRTDTRRRRPDETYKDWQERASSNISGAEQRIKFESANIIHAIENTTWALAIPLWIIAAACAYYLVGEILSLVQL